MKSLVWGRADALHIWARQYQSEVRRAVLLIGIVAQGSLATCAETENNQLFRIRADGSGLQQLTHRPKWCFGSPKWSPDGRRIAADGWLVAEYKQKSYSATHLFIMNADGSELRDIGMGAMPSWSPEGGQLTCHTYDNPRTIIVINDDGSGREVVAEHWGSPRWSPQGHWIASMSGSGIALLNLVTGIEAQVGVAPDWSPKLGFSWSPEGRQIAFINRQPAGLAILTLDDHGQARDVRLRVAAARSVRMSWLPGTSWSPDARMVIFSMRSNVKSPSQIYVVDVVEDGPPRRLPGQPENRDNCSPDWSPDRQWIVFSGDVPD